MNTSTYSYEATPFSNDWFNAKHIGQQPEHLSVAVDNVVITELGIN
ncbi:hypothetical protein WUBG_09480 [Wuchereria bancrofti]|uniref:Uncharacterized protein n=1 Tax=Wuchereria bancrofti TaxID=6293 RepID=J9EWQ1_WUCBA|nr:hypothetical protein WUBG_09480 [Wuchereria bancrofti]